MPELLATADEFATRHGTLTNDEQLTVEALLEDASALIFDEAEGSEEDWVTDPATNDPPHPVKQVCIAAAYRAWSNEDALNQMTSTDMSVTYGGRRKPPDALYLSNREKVRVHRAAGVTGPATVTLVSPYSGD